MTILTNPKPVPTKQELAFKSLFDRLQKAQKEEHEQTLSNLKTQISQQKQDLIENMRKSQELVVQLTDGASAGSTKEALDRIKNMVQVKALDVTQEHQTTTLSVYTTPITITTLNKSGTADRRYMIGPMKICMLVDRLGGASIFFYSLWYRIKGYSDRPCCHPHVWGDGAQCLGSIEEPIQKALQSGDLFSAVYLSIAFLESVNTADTAGKYVTMWPYIYSDGTLRIPYHGREPRDVRDSLSEPVIRFTNPDLDNVDYMHGKDHCKWKDWADAITTTGGSY